MSSALAIAGVSAVLQYYLANLYTGLSALFGGTVTVSAKAPDLVQESFAPGSLKTRSISSSTRSRTTWAGAIRTAVGRRRTAMTRLGESRRWRSTCITC